MKLNTMIKRNEKVAWQSVEDKVVVVTPKTRKIHILYGSAGKVWRSLEEPMDFRQILSAVCDEYEVDRRKAEQDLKVFLGELLDKEIISLG